jgi:hypothetical protein
MPAEKHDTSENHRAEKQAKAKLKRIHALVGRLKIAEQQAQEGPDETDAARNSIHEHPLCVETRSGWMPIGHPDRDQPEEYRILLCSGGPAVRITGDLNEYGEPANVRLQYQDWFTPWIDYPLNCDDGQAVLAYVQQFYFGG